MNFYKVNGVFHFYNNAIAFITFHDYSFDSPLIYIYIYGHKFLLNFVWKKFLSSYSYFNRW